MAVTLDATLQTAQDSASHHPIVELKSVPEDNIPFDGNLLTTETTNEQKPNAITHSSGRVVTVYKFGDGTIKFVYTDTARTEFFTVTLDYTDLDYGSSDDVIEATICELDNGNIGVILTVESGSNIYLRYAVLSVVGVVSSYGLIATYAKASYDEVLSPFVINDSGADYLLVYIVNDGSTYKIYKRTDTDFVSWSAESEITISGLSTTNQKTTVSLLEISTGDIFLWVDYYTATTYSNIYYSISSDNGATWAAAVQLTSYDSVVVYGVHPIAAQKEADAMHIVYNERRGALHMDEDTTGWPDVSYTNVSDITLDIVNRRLYILNANIGGGIKALESVIEINIDTWTILRSWTESSVPSINSVFFNEHIWFAVHHGERYLVPFGAGLSADQITVGLLNANANQVLQFNFHDWSEYSLSKNVSWDSGYGSHEYWYLAKTWADFNSGRLYCLLYSTYLYSRKIYVGYIDVYETIASDGEYTFNDIIKEENSVTQEEIFELKDGDFLILPDEDLIVVSMHADTLAWKGRLRVYILSTGALSKDYKIDTFAQFPYRGLRSITYYDGKIYGSFDYESDYGEGDKRGLCEINLSTDAISYYRPSWDTLDEYELQQMTVTEDEKILIVTNGYGVTLFDIGEESWTQIDNDSLPGLTPDGEDEFFNVRYDSTTGMIYTGVSDSGNSFKGLIGFSRYGELNRSYYKTGTYTDSWAFGDSNPLVQGINDFDAAITLDPDDQTIYAFWTNKDEEELSIKWDKELADLDLLQYVLADREIIMERNIEGKPNRLVFTLACGHLFDPHNPYSLLRPYLLKGKKITYRLGEIVSDTDYWASQGSYLVTSLRISEYRRGKYPTARIECFDARIIWEDLEMVASSYYSDNYPEDILDSLLTNKVELAAGDIDIPTFDNRSKIWHQWLDADVNRALNDICYRYSYFARLDMDNKFAPRKIADDNSVDHVYTLDSIISFSPDDSYADFVNQVAVVGEERTYQSVTYSEEAVISKNGSIGWWQGTERIRCYYSPDGERTCINPRISWHTQPTGLFRWLGAINIRMIEDSDDRYVDVEIGGPNLFAILVNLFILLGLKAFVPDKVQVGPSGTGFTIPTGRIAYNVVLFSILNTLASITNWQFTIYAQPTGRVRRSIQATADDTDHQTQVGKVASKKIEEPLCYAINECQQVADQELMIARLQRKRVKLTKPAHLQDEEGDTITIPHPYTGDTLSIFITNLTRSVRRGTEGNGGVLTDEIEGWVV